MVNVKKILLGLKFATLLWLNPQESHLLVLCHWKSTIVPF